MENIEQCFRKIYPLLIEALRRFQNLSRARGSMFSAKISCQRTFKEKVLQDLFVFDMHSIREVQALDVEVDTLVNESCHYNGRLVKYE